MLPEADLMAKRAALSWLRERHPQWAPQEPAAILGRSRSWMSTWLPRLHQANPCSGYYAHPFVKLRVIRIFSGHQYKIEGVSRKSYPNQ